MNGRDGGTRPRGERERAEERLQRAEERLRRFLSGAYHGIEGPEAFAAALNEVRAAEAAMKALGAGAPSRLAA